MVHLCYVSFSSFFLMKRQERLCSPDSFLVRLTRQKLAFKSSRRNLQRFSRPPIAYFRWEGYRQRRKGKKGLVGAEGWIKEEWNKESEEGGVGGEIGEHGFPRDSWPGWRKGAITSKIKHAIKLKTIPARLAQLLQPSLAFCFSLQPKSAF